MLPNLCFLEVEGEPSFCRRLTTRHKPPAEPAVQFCTSCSTTTFSIVTNIGICLILCRPSRRHSALIAAASIACLLTPDICEAELQGHVVFDLQRLVLFNCDMIWIPDEHDRRCTLDVSLPSRVMMGFETEKKC